LVQYRIKQSRKEPLGSSTSGTKSKNVTNISTLNKDDESLPISLYDNKVLYMMQQMGYDVAAGPSLCDGRGQLAPFEKMLSPEQREALHEDQVLEKKKHGIGYQVCMASTEFMDMTEAAPQMEDGNQSTVDDLEEINIGTTDDPRPIFISKHLSEENKKTYYEFLCANRDVFAWTYEEMPGLNPEVAVHRLAIQDNVAPVKQAQRKYRPEILPKNRG
jgi:hypothetical protein